MSKRRLVVVVAAAAAVAATAGMASASDGTGLLETTTNGAYHHVFITDYTCDNSAHVINFSFLGDGNNGSTNSGSGTGTLTPAPGGGGTFVFGGSNNGYGYNYVGSYDAAGTWFGQSATDTASTSYTADQIPGDFTGIPDCGTANNLKPSQGSPVNNKVTAVFQAQVASNDPACVAGRTVHFTLDNGVPAGTALTDAAGVASYKVAGVVASTYTQSVHVDATASCMAIDGAPGPAVIATKKK